MSRRHPSVDSTGENGDAHKRTMSDGEAEDPVEAISRVAAHNDQFRKTIVRKATILKKGVSFNQQAERRKVRKRREDSDEACHSPPSSPESGASRIPDKTPYDSDGVVESSF